MKFKYIRNLSAPTQSMSSNKPSEMKKNEHQSKQVITNSFRLLYRYIYVGKELKDQFHHVKMRDKIGSQQTAGQTTRWSTAQLVSPIDAYQAFTSTVDIKVMHALCKTHSMQD